MIGSNQLSLNQATLNAAVEHYLNTRVFRDGEQVSVTRVDENGSEFNVTIEPAAAPKPSTK